MSAARISACSPWQRYVGGIATAYLLAALAAFLWLRDLSWLGSGYSGITDTLPAIAALPLLALFGAPWHLRAQANPWPGHITAGGAALLATGMAVESNILLAAGWTFLFWAGVRANTTPETQTRVYRLLPLAFFGFPWLALDGQAVGWWLRLTSAAATGDIFAALGFAVHRSGVFLLIQGLPVSVDPACSGVNTLQVMVIIGLALAFVTPGAIRRLPVPILITLLAAAGWMANTLRLVLLCAAALTFGVPFARGAFHAWGGLLVLALMFAICSTAFSIVGRKGALPCK